MAALKTCHGKNCESRQICRRYTTPPSIPPQWSSFDVNREGHSCDGYLHDAEAMLERNDRNAPKL